MIGGLFNALPQDSHEVKQGRIHGNRNAVWGSIATNNPNLVMAPESLNFLKTQI